ncbi:HET-domain-containing protein, partial [Mytilinidion resinicola]
MDRCIFCSLLYSTDSTGELSSSRQAWPLYHWAFRTLPRGRELKGSMILRFWSTQPTLVSKSFRFFPGNDFHIPSSNELQHSTDPKESGGYQIKEWMETCTRHHAGCSKNPDDKRPGASFLPTRLIDVDTGDENVVRLIETKITKVKGPYCTLSHAWGPPEKKFLTTTVWNMAKHLLNGIKMSELPPNFQQAIEITRFLKIRYIWIDSLVIVQEPYGDFVKEGDLMHKVYRYSYCNIVAADSSDGYGGLFRKRDPHAVLPVEFRATEATYGLGKKAWTIVPADLWERELLNSFIYTRGWVFQERMLSPRILHFTKHQIFWDCNTLSACEAFPTGLPLHLDKKASTDRHWRGRLDQSQISSRALCGANDDESSYTFWMSAVQNYTDCNLTNQGDKTVAIWSVAKLLRDISSEEYVVGMWSTFLEEQLAWRVRDIDRSERFPELQIDIPSWSWASIKGPILPQHRLAMRSYKVKNHKGGDVSFTIE